MRSIHIEEMTVLAAKSTTPLGKLVVEALADQDLKLAKALETRLEKAGYTITFDDSKENRCSCHVHVNKTFKPENGEPVTTTELVARSYSDTRSNAMEYAMLGAMRENK